MKPQSPWSDHGHTLSLCKPARRNGQNGPQNGQNGGQVALVGLGDRDRVDGHVGEGAITAIGRNVLYCFNNVEAFDDLAEQGVRRG